MYQSLTAKHTSTLLNQKKHYQQTPKSVIDFVRNKPFPYKSQAITLYL